MRLIISLTIALLCLTSSTMEAQSQKSKLAVKGNLLDPLKDFDSVSLILTVDHNETHEIPLSRRGEFHFKIYPDEHYSLTFKRKGFVEKYLEIDTWTPDNIELVGTIEFNVFMERLGRLKDDTKLCAEFFYSSKENTLIYTRPEDDKIYFALQPPMGD